MPIKKDRIGKRYGRLVVVSFVSKGTRPGTGPIWFCKCDCGVEKNFTSNYLNRYPHTKNLSCGCGRFYKWNNTQRGTINSAWAQFKNQAKKRELKMYLTFEEWFNFTQAPCYYCGTERSNTHQKASPYGTDFTYNGIDRKDSTKGYTLDNCVTSCRTCNMAKRLMDEQEFVQWINRAYLHTNNKKTAYTGI